MEEGIENRMKSLIFKLLIILFKSVMRFIYFFMKLFKTKNNRILFCSRQSNTASIDFKLLQEELLNRDENLEIITICNRMKKTPKSLVSFAIDMLRSMYYLATSKVCIVDSYWPAVSILKHKKTLKVVQIWHSIGKIKKSGYQSVGKGSGRSANVAYWLDMHKNYDYIIAGAKSWNKFYCESFNVSEDVLLNYGLPRIDYLINTADNNKEKFFEENPSLIGKKIVLYTPTFRRNMEDRWNEITKVNWPEDIALIIKLHPNQDKTKDVLEKDNIYYFDEWKTADLISVCDYMVTDYSAIALEAAILNKKTFYWTYDYEQYTTNNGVNINLLEYVMNNVEPDLDKLVNKIVEDNFDEQEFELYRKRFLPEELGVSTYKIVDLIESLM